MEIDTLDSADTETETPISAKSNDSGSVDGRQRLRARTLLTGVIISDDALIDVLVHDLSATGARVTLKGETPGSLAFKIRVNGVGQFRAITRWRKGTALGVQFLDSPEQVAHNISGRFKSVFTKQ